MLHRLQFFCVAAGILLFAAPAFADDPVPNDTCAPHAPTGGVAGQQILAIYSKHNPPDTDPTLEVVADNNPFPNTYIALAACVEYKPVNKMIKYYEGSITNVFLDTNGHYLGSNGQQLLGSNSSPLEANSGHLFGAGLHIGYQFGKAEDPSKTDSVATQVLVETTIFDCTTPQLASCGGTPRSFITLFNTTPVETNPPHEHYHSCAWPEAKYEDEKNSHPEDTSDDAFRLYAEGSMLVQDDVSVSNPITRIGIVACLRLIPQPGNKANVIYAAQALAYVFDLNGRVLGLGSQPLAIGGQQLGVVESPKPKIIDNDENFISEKGPIHDFGVTLAAPLHSHNDIDRHVLLALTINCIDASDKCPSTAPRTYYRIVDTCAPGLTGGEFDADRCWGKVNKDIMPSVLP